jgi:hypothetical protein
MENMFTNGFILSNIGKVGILVYDIHVLYHLMQSVFFLEVLLEGGN